MGKLTKAVQSPALTLTEMVDVAHQTVMKAIPIYTWARLNNVTMVKIMIAMGELMIDAFVMMKMAMAYVLALIAMITTNL